MGTIHKVEFKHNLSVGAINVNSFNVSTLGARNSKTYLKVEAITQHKYDVIFICDCRLKNKGGEVSKLMGLNRNESYKFYYNSVNESRGVAIAIKRKIFHVVSETYASQD